MTQPQVAYTCNWSSKRRKREEGTEQIIREIIAKNFPNLMKPINPHFQIQRTPSRRCMNLPQAHHNHNDKKKILKTARERRTCHIKEQK